MPEIVQVSFYFWVNMVILPFLQDKKQSFIAAQKHFINASPKQLQCNSTEIVV
jgi:hypothetical protein